MKSCVRISAILVFMGNSHFLSSTGLASIGWMELIEWVLVSTVIGLVIAEPVIRLARPMLQGRFLARYAAMALAICAGGMLWGVIMTVAGVFSVGGNILDLIGGAVVIGFIGAVAGGALGLAEGLVLGIPLAVILGFFRDREEVAENE